MPNRILKESICTSRGLAACSIFAQDLYKRLITYADDYGRFNADTEIMLARLYPRETDTTTQYDINEALVELAGAGKVAFYTSYARKDVYGAFPNWENHQRVRDSKKKTPDPDDTSINDWYLKRFVSIEMKTAILEREKFKCAECGKALFVSDLDAKTIIKMCSGLFHFDHIVPVSQGGRATYENIRVTCPKCNLSRKRRFSFKEILLFASSGDDSPPIPASCGELRPNPIQSKSIQSESNPNTNAVSKTNSKWSDQFHEFWKAYPLKMSKAQAEKAWKNIKPTPDLFESILAAIEVWKKSERWNDQGGKFIPYPASWLNAKGWEDEYTEIKPGKGKGQDEEPREVWIPRGVE